jgi:hypothetical protein
LECDYVVRKSNAFRYGCAGTLVVAGVASAPITVPLTVATAVFSGIFSLFD